MIRRVGRRGGARSVSLLNRYLPSNFDPLITIGRCTTQMGKVGKAYDKGQDVPCH